MSAKTKAQLTRPRRYPRQWACAPVAPNLASCRGRGFEPTRRLEACGSSAKNIARRTRKARRRAPARGRDDLAAHHYQAIIELSDDAILSKDLDGVILSWNHGAERLFGFTAEEAIGKPVTIIIPLDRRDEEPAILEKIHRGERIDHFETVRQRKDGSLLDISLTISPIRNRAGRSSAPRKSRATSRNSRRRANGSTCC